MIGARPRLSSSSSSSRGFRKRARTEVTFVWGEEDGGSAKPTVERHVQTEMRPVVSPVPHAESVRRSYAPGSWRAARA
jgi:hypothetical protein